jgi:N-acetylglucosamine-6-phosphate deacetylase
VIVSAKVYFVETNPIMSMQSEGELTAWHYQTHRPVCVRWRKGRITEVLAATITPPKELWVAPSLFDLQVNGFAGVDFQQDGLKEEDLLAAVRGLRMHGCTRFLLTLITDSWPKLTSRLRHLRMLRASCPELEFAIAGWHVEGPFLSAEPGFHGAHDEKLMMDPRPEHIRELRELTKEDPLLLTVAPERKGAIEALSLARSLGIRISLGHTNASAATLQQAVEAGATGYTHLGNGCAASLDRHDNILWRVFETPGLTVSLIPDRAHVSPSLFRIVHRLLGPGSVVFVSDAMAAGGSPPGRYRLGKLELEVGEDQVVRQPGSPYLAGSALNPADGVKFAAQMLGCAWQDCWQRFSDLPARFMGLRSGLSPGDTLDAFLIRTSSEGEGLQLLALTSTSRERV